MNKRRITILFFYTIVLIGVAACKSHNKKLIDEFKKVDSSLQNTQGILPAADSLKMLDIQILARQQANPRLAIMADSLFMITNYAINYIDSLRGRLTAPGSTVETTTSTNKLFENDKTGKLLYRYLLQVHNYAVKVITTKSRQVEVDNIFADIISMGDDKVFIKKYFLNMPGFAASTILTKFNKDCYKAAIITLADVKEALVKTQ